MKYVTFHWHIVYGISAYKEHKNKEEALKYFNQNAHRYFELGSKFKAKDLPASYGYSHRKFMGMSIRMFNKNFIEEKGE